LDDDGGYMTPTLRTALTQAVKPHRLPHLQESLGAFTRWLTFVNFAGVGQTYQQKVASLGGLHRAVEKFEVMQ
jgi:hypothetical protein